jgi:hypothetical protein
MTALDAPAAAPLGPQRWNKREVEHDANETQEIARHFAFRERSA